MFPPPACRAFARTELLAVVAAVIMLAMIVIPALAATKSDSGRMVCYNNLRLINRGAMAWAADHNRQFSWRGWPSIEGGGQVPALRPPILWTEYFILSNELVTPAILACPADAGVRRARVFDWDPNGGLPVSTYRDNSVSYPLNLDGSMDLPRSWMTGDRNFQTSGVRGTCSAGVFIANTLWMNDPSLQWTNAVHGDGVGHLVTTDGAVEFTSSTRLRDVVYGAALEDAGQIHFLRGR